MENMQEKQVYELGFHLVPTLDESSVVSAVEAIKSLVEKHQGEHISEETPEMMDLAYEISRKLKGKKEVFTRSHFGSVKFRVLPSEVEELQNELDADLDIFRYILFRTVEEDTRAPADLFADDKKDDSPVIEDISAEADDLTKIEGVGPKIAEVLFVSGIISFTDLAKSTSVQIREILDTAGSNFAAHDPATWPKQAALARDGKWDELKKLQDELDGGKVV